MRRLAYVGAIALLAAACSASDGVNAELKAAEERWARSGVSDYTMEIGYGCFCVRERIGPFAVTVRDGAVVEIRFDGAPIRPEPGVTPVEVFTVEGLFEKIRSRIDADEITVSYAELGNPTLIDIDQILDAVDDELTITATLTTS